MIVFYFVAHDLINNVIIILTDYYGRVIIV